MSAPLCERCGGVIAEPTKRDGAPRRYCSPRCTQLAKTKHGCHPLGRLWTPDEVALLIARYDGRTTTIDALARRLRRDRRSIVAKAAHLGLTRGRRHPTVWSPEMDDRLRRDAPTAPWPQLAKALGVSETAVRVRAKRLAIYRDGDAFTARSAAEILGADTHKVLGWITSGKLMATRVSSAPHAPHRIIPTALRRFILTYPAEIDLRRVETSGFKATFLDVVAGRTDNGPGAFGEDGFARGEGSEEGLA